MTNKTAYAARVWAHAYAAVGVLVARDVLVYCVLLLPLLRNAVTERSITTCAAAATAMQQKRCAWVMACLCSWEEGCHTRRSFTRIEIIIRVSVWLY